MADSLLSARDLNRALLERQFLLARADCGPLAALDRLVALQAQIPNPPYLGLWSRLRHFERAALEALLERRAVVRAATLRSTLHLVAADDYLAFYGALQPALIKALSAFFGKKMQALDITTLLPLARQALAAPLRMAAIGRLLAEHAPGYDPEALAYAARAYLPLVQVPPAGGWGTGTAADYALAEPWLGRDIDPAARLGELFRRYLRAFGPATVMDFQAWTGLTKLAPALAPLLPGLRVLRDDRGRELFDLPDAPLPGAAAPAPPRFVPEYDNLLLAHADRSRIIADHYRPLVFLSAARVRATFLIDGFVRGAWSLKREKRRATLTIEPFAPLAPEERRALAAEAEGLLAFAEQERADRAVVFAD